MSITTCGKCGKPARLYPSGRVRCFHCKPDARKQGNQEVGLNDPEQVKPRYQAMFRLKQQFYPRPVPYEAATAALGDEAGGYTRYDHRARTVRRKR